MRRRNHVGGARVGVSNEDHDDADPEPGRSWSGRSTSWSGTKLVAPAPLRSTAPLFLPRLVRKQWSSKDGGDDDDGAVYVPPEPNSQMGRWRPPPTSPHGCCCFRRMSSVPPPPAPPDPLLPMLYLGRALQTDNDQDKAEVRRPTAKAFSRSRSTGQLRAV
jgi:hypothetical protein